MYVTFVESIYGMQSIQKQLPCRQYLSFKNFTRNTEGDSQHTHTHTPYTKYRCKNHMVKNVKLNKLRHDFENVKISL